MTIHFKNGEIREISQQIADILNKEMLKGSKRFQTFMDQNDNVFLFINVEEIVYID